MKTSHDDGVSRGGDVNRSPCEDRFWMRRLSGGYLSWHSYKTEKSRARWAKKYVAQGDQVWTGTPFALAWIVPSQPPTGTVPSRVTAVIHA